jgi:hypothetical protein
VVFRDKFLETVLVHVLLPQRKACKITSEVTQLSLQDKWTQCIAYIGGGKEGGRPHILYPSEERRVEMVVNDKAGVKGLLIVR